MITRKNKRKQMFGETNGTCNLSRAGYCSTTYSLNVVFRFYLHKSEELWEELPNFKTGKIFEVLNWRISPILPKISLIMSFWDITRYSKTIEVGPSTLRYHTVKETVHNIGEVCGPAVDRRQTDRQHLAKDHFSQFLFNILHV